MFNDEVKILTPYDKYVILVSDLNDSYFFANRAYQHGQFQIEFKNTEFADKYLANINTYRDKLKRDFELVMQIRAKVNEQSIGESEKQLFLSDNDLFDKIQELLTKMENFLSQHNTKLSI